MEKGFHLIGFLWNFCNNCRAFMHLYAWGCYGNEMPCNLIEILLLACKLELWLLAQQIAIKCTFRVTHTHCCALKTLTGRIRYVQVIKPGITYTYTPCWCAHKSQKPSGTRQGERLPAIVGHDMLKKWLRLVCECQCAQCAATWTCQWVFKHELTHCRTTRMSCVVCRLPHLLPNPCLAFCYNILLCSSTCCGCDGNSQANRQKASAAGGASR